MRFPPVLSVLRLLAWYWVRRRLFISHSARRFRETLLDAGLPSGLAEELVSEYSFRLRSAYPGLRELVSTL